MTRSPRWRKLPGALGVVLAASAAGIALTACGGDEKTNGARTLPQGSEPVRLDPADFTTEIDNRLVLVSHHSTPSTGPNLNSQLEAINQKMHYLSTNHAAVTDYQLTLFSLTNWPAIP